MSNALVTIPPRPPSKLAKMWEEKSNIVAPSTVPTLSPGGKRWTISRDGKSQVIFRKTEDGDKEPMQTIRVIVVNFNARRGRSYYEGTFNPENPLPPKCWSVDGVAPDQSVEEKQNPTCTGCAWSAKGSKTVGGRESVACSEHRMLAVVPVKQAGDVKNVLRLKLAITSDWDARSPDHEAEGWFAWSNYMKMLRANTIAHSAQVVTKMKFDTNVDYPKVLFAFDRYLADEEEEQVAAYFESQPVLDLIGGTWTPAGADGVRTAKHKEIGTTTDTDSGGVAQAEAAAAQAAAEAEAKKKAAKAAADAKAKAAAEKAAEAAKKAAEEEAARKAAAAEDADDDIILEDADDDSIPAKTGEVVVNGSPAAAAANKAKATQPAVGATQKKGAVATPSVNPVITEDTAALLGEWDE